MKYDHTGNEVPAKEGEPIDANDLFLNEELACDGVILCMEYCEER